MHLKGKQQGQIEENQKRNILFIPPHPFPALGPPGGTVHWNPQDVLHSGLPPPKGYPVELKQSPAAAGCWKARRYPGISNQQTMYDTKMYFWATSPFFPPLYHCVSLASHRYRPPQSLARRFWRCWFFSVSRGFSLFLQCLFGLFYWLWNGFFWLYFKGFPYNFLVTF